MCRVSFKPQEETKGLKGTVHRTGLPRGQTQFSRRVLSERATGCVGDDPGTVSGPWGSTARLLMEHECVKGAPTQESAIAHEADGASTPRRATIPRTGGQRPKDRQATLRFNTAGDYVLLWFFLFVPVADDFLVFVALRCSTLSIFFLGCFFLCPASSLFLSPWPGYFATASS